MKENLSIWPWSKLHWREVPCFLVGREVEEFELGALRALGLAGDVGWAGAVLPVEAPLPASSSEDRGSALLDMALVRGPRGDVSAFEALAASPPAPTRRPRFAFRSLLVTTVRFQSPMWER